MYLHVGVVFENYRLKHFYGFLFQIDVILTKIGRTLNKPQQEIDIYNKIECYVEIQSINALL